MLQSDTQINYNDNKCGDSVQDRIQPEMDLGNQRGHDLSRHPRGCPSVRVSSGLWGRCCSSSLCSGGDLEVGSDVLSRKRKSKIGLQFQFDWTKKVNIFWAINLKTLFCELVQNSLSTTQNFVHRRELLHFTLCLDLAIILHN